MTRVVVLGKGTLACRVAQWFRTNGHLGGLDYSLAAVVPVWPEPTWTDSLYAWAKNAGTPIILDHRLATGVDLAISAFYDQVFSPAWLVGQKRTLNIHLSALPEYRGVRPLNWAMRHGATQHGVTIHDVTPAIDAGPIVAQSTFPLYPGVDDLRSAYARAVAHAWTLFETTFPLLDRIQPVEQDHQAASYYSLADSPRLGDWASW